MRNISSIDVDRINARNRAAWGRRDRGERADGDAEPERAGLDGPQEEARAEEAPARYRLRCLHFRRHDADVTNPSIKAALDGIVASGLIRDDSRRYIADVAHEIVLTQGDERTVFVFTRTE